MQASLRNAFLGTVLVTATGVVQASIIADSVAEFSDVQGQDGWSYGVFVAGADPSALTPYTTAGFREFDTFVAASMRWEASDALVGPQNNDFLSINSSGGHPAGLGPGNQDQIIWAMRRYTADADGLVEISFDLGKENTGEPRGGGITGRIFLDGNEIFSSFIANDDGAGIQDSFVLNLSTGSVLDLAIDPTGVSPTTGGDGAFSARADGSRFSVLIDDSVILSEPGSRAALALGLALVAGGVHGRRNAEA